MLCRRGGINELESGFTFAENYIFDMKMIEQIDKAVVKDYQLPYVRNF